MSSSERFFFFGDVNALIGGSNNITTYFLFVELEVCGLLCNQL